MIAHGRTCTVMPSSYRQVLLQALAVRQLGSDRIAISRRQLPRTDVIAHCSGRLSHLIALSLRRRSARDIASCHRMGALGPPPRPELPAWRLRGTAAVELRLRRHYISVMRAPFTVPGC